MAPDLTDVEKIHLYREMVRIRKFEQAAMKQYCNGKMGGFLILSIGQEGAPVALRSIMGPNDHTITGPRGIAAALASGMEMGPMMSELYGHTNGCSQGKGGMFSFFDPSKNHWGCHATAAAQTPLALGFAYALKYQETPGASFCFLGDGAANQGVFHESQNLAGLLDVPVVYLLENNNYAMGTSVERGSSYRDCLAKRAEGYAIDWDVARGWEIDELRLKMSEARDRAIEQSRPTVLEIQTYRYFGFTVSDANHKKYRTPEEISFHREHRDPITNWGDQLIAEGLVKQADLRALMKTAKQEAQEAVDYAEAGKAPRESDLTRHVYWEIDHTSKAASQGRYFFNDDF